MSPGNEPLPHVALQIVRGRSTRKSRPMAGGTLLVGSDPQCDVQLRSAEVAARHCLVSRRDGQVTVTRLSAEHPVLVNGKPTAEEIVRHGDELTIGPFAMKILVGAEADSKVPPSAPPIAVARPRFALLDRKPSAAATAIAGAPPEIAELESEPTTRVAEVRADLAETERKLQVWQERLQHAEAELQDRLARLADDLADFDVRRRVLDGRRERLRGLLGKHRVERRKQRSRFAALLGATDERQAGLGRRERGLEERERRLTAVQAGLDERLTALHERAAAANRQIAQLEAKQAALVGERTLLDKEWQRLFARQHEVARESTEVAERAAKVAGDERALQDVRRRTAQEVEELGRDRAEVQARAAAIDAQAVRLHGHERKLDARARELVERARDADRRDRELDAVADGLKRDAENLRDAVERERAEIARRKSALEAEFARHEAEKAAFVQSQSAWRSAVERHERERIELGRAASVLAARERELAERAAASAAALQAEIAAERRKLAAEQERLAAQADAMDRERAELERRSAELADAIHGLETRQEQLLRRERALAEAAESERRAIDERATALAAKHADVDRLAEAQRRQFERMRSAGFRFGQRRKILLDRLAELDAKSAAYRKEIAALTSSRDDLRRELDAFVARARERERQAALWLRSIRQDAEQLADAHRRLDRQVRASDPRAAGERTELQRRLGEWSQRMVRLQERLADGARALSLDEQTVPPPSAQTDRALAPPTDAPLAELAPPEEAPPDTIPLVAGATASPAWVHRLAELGLADREVIDYLLSRCKPGGPPIERTLVENAVVTQYQVDCVRENRVDDLSLGPIRILDVVHRGRLQTVYRVRTAGFDRDVALRLFAPTVGASPEMRRALAAALTPLVSFRHPNVASIYALAAHRDQIGLVTDFVLGAPLVDGQAERDPKTTIRCFRQAAVALAAVQRAGFVHRNLRPSRILVSRLGRVSLVGFGEPDWLVNLYRCEVGDAYDRFLAPERREPGRTADARADLFAAARIFLEAILGRQPDSPASWTLPDEYPAAFAEILVRCLASAPDARCRSIMEIVALLDELLPSSATPPAETHGELRLAA